MRLCEKIESIFIVDISRHTVIHSYILLPHLWLTAVILYHQTACIPTLKVLRWQLNDSTQDLRWMNANRDARVGILHRECLAMI